MNNGRNLGAEFACAECGTMTATTYVVTGAVGDTDGRTEVCAHCAHGLLDPDGDAVADAHRYTVPLGAGSPPFCSRGVVGGNGINRPLLADHLREVGHPDFDR